MKYYIDITGMEDKLSFFRDELNKIDEYINKLKSDYEKLEWIGDASASFKNSYTSYLSTLEDMKMGLLHYSKILASFNGKYNDFYDEMEEEFKKSLNEMENNKYEQYYG